MTRWLLVRHGRTRWNKDQRIQGQADIPLDSLGLQQADRLGERLATEHIHTVYSSDLRRTLQTLAPFTEGKHTVQQDARLRELGLGRFEGLVYADIEQLYPDELAAWKIDRNNAPPQGEKFSELVTRTQAFYEETRAKHTDETILIGSHAGTLRVLMCLIADLPPARHRLFHFDNASLTEVLFSKQGATIIYLNDICHLGGLGD